ncbi:FtsX-like permease family protein [Lacticaseibacillus porcinae]|uniref:FtsX-like permease family protein n=1 Tax=Lacticaseibacillus porcinae TaxID=1123687 RepID=UPI0013DDFCB1|nr:FtsX-like permease family protein [Lacticaseibacillus porcinae]
MWQQIRTDLHRHRGMNQLFAIVLGILVAMMYAIAALIEAQPLLNQIGKGSQMTSIFPAALVVVLVVMMLFSVMFMVYLNGLLIARREREFQLYRRLGMPQWRLNSSLIGETLISGGVGLIGGLLGGIVISKLLAMVLLRLVDSSQSVGLLVSPVAIAEVAGVVLVLLLALGGLRAISASGRDVMIKAEASPEKAVVQPITAKLVIGAIGGIGLLGWATWVLAALFFWTTQFVQWFGGNAGLGLLFVSWGIAEVIGVYLVYACTLPLIIAMHLKQQPHLTAKHYLWLVAMYKRLRVNTQSLWLTTWLTTVTLVMLGSAAMLYQFGQAVVVQDVAQSILTTKAGMPTVKKQIQVGDVAHTWELPTKLAAGRVQLRMRNHSDKQENSLYQVIALRDYQRIRRHQRDLPKVTLHSHQTVMITIGQTYYQTKGIGGWDNAGRQLTLSRTGEQLTLKTITNVFPLGGAGYFDRALVVSNHVYDHLQAPVDQLTGIKLKPTARKRVESALLNTNTVDYVAYDHATLAGQKPIKHFKHATDTTIDRDGISLRRPALHQMRVVFGFLLFTMTLLGVVFMVATASILLLKQLVSAHHARHTKVTLRRLGMPAKDLADLQVAQVVSVFGLPLVLGSFNAILGIRVLQMALDGSPSSSVIIAFGAYTLVYVGFASITAMRLNQM